jgi:hypothetical protein
MFVGSGEAPIGGVGVGALTVSIHALLSAMVRCPFESKMATLK